MSLEHAILGFLKLSPYLGKDLKKIIDASVQIELMEDPEFILCGTCIDNCAKSAIRYSYSASK